MTILPTKRPANTEEKSDSGQHHESPERILGRRNDRGLPVASSSNRRTQRPCVKSTSEKKERLRSKVYKQPARTRTQEQEREQKRKVKRDQKRDQAVAIHDVSNEALNDKSAGDPEVEEPTSNNNELGTVVDKEDCTGYNSEDEYDDQGVVNDRNLSNEEWQKREDCFSRSMSSLGFEIKQINEDGACLFRSIADQVYGDQEFHDQVRQDCMNYIVQNRNHFEPYVTEDFDKYVARKRKWNVHGNHLEIQALSELYNRTIEVYCYQMTPINIFNSSTLRNSREPIRLSYHRMCHYNSISNPNKPSVGVGLELPRSYQTSDVDRKCFNDAVRASDEMLIEQTMLEDKLKATDWEATNEAIEEQVARESYIQYFRDSERRLKNQASSSSSTATSSMIPSPRSSRRGSFSPKSPQSPKETFQKTTLSPNEAVPSKDISAVENVSTTCVSGTEEYVFAKHSPQRTHPAEDNVVITKYCTSPQAGSAKKDCFGVEDFDEEIMAQVLAESQKTYLEELKKLRGSPEPSASS